MIRRQRLRQPSRQAPPAPPPRQRTVLQPPRVPRHIKPRPRPPQPIYEPIPNTPPQAEALVSQIDPAFPVFGNPTTASVRSNFAAARNEIEALQDEKLDLAGGTMTGQIVFVAEQDVDGGTF